ncbi:MAG TPA: crosslink repair DNA glycosylase YcaQ family protein [Chloroflexota bacterium]|nr:crosslink repair DNA glycosylase YcaQ family protein [Chloroflexota bacterium]
MVSNVCTSSHPRATLSLTEARALVLRAQGFDVARLVAPSDVLAHLGAIQLDSVNVLARSHEIVPFSRLGPCSSADLHRAVYRERRGFEYWGHVASLLPMAEYRYFLPRMEVIRARGWWWGEHSEHSQLIPRILERIRAEGPLGSAAFEDPRERRGSWWNWKPAKEVLEFLFARGELLVADRTNGFARLYDLAERVLPPGLDLSNPGPAAANRHLLKRAIAAQGIATGPEAADYFRLNFTPWQPRGVSWKTALAELLEAGEIIEVTVEGTETPSFAVPSALEGSLEPPRHRPTFLSPFDNLVWTRETQGDRIERLFGFRYRIELYVPGPKRVYGYYVLPLLARGTLGGRADLKLDRKAGALLVRALYLEGASPEDAASALAHLATHLGVRTIQLDRVVPESDLTAVRTQLQGELTANR